MEEETTIAPEVEAKETETVAEVLQATEAEKTVSEVLETEVQEEKKETKMVPEAALIKIKRQNKELSKKIDSLQALIEDGGEKSEIKSSIEAIAEEHNIDPKFLRDLTKAVKTEAESEIEEKISSRMKPLEEKEKADRFNSLFNKEFERTIETKPEFKDIVNKEVIKTLVKDPANGKKTLSQIIEDAYGNLLTGKRTLEKTTPRGGNEVTDIDYKRASSDTEYFKEIMANPKSKAKYNAGLASRIGL